MDKLERLKDGEWKPGMTLAMDILMTILAIILQLNKRSDMIFGFDSDYQLACEINLQDNFVNIEYLAYINLLRTFIKLVLFFWCKSQEM